MYDFHENKSRFMKRPSIRQSARWAKLSSPSFCREDLVMFLGLDRRRRWSISSIYLPTWTVGSLPFEDVQRVALEACSWSNHRRRPPLVIPSLRLLGGAILNRFLLLAIFVNCLVSYLEIPRRHAPWCLLSWINPKMLNSRRNSRHNAMIRSNIRMLADFYIESWH